MSLLLSRKIPPITILIFLLFQFSFADWSNLMSGAIVIPPHTYKIKMYTNQTLKGTLTWSGGDLDMYLYKSGSNILKDYEALARYASNSFSNQVFTFISLQQSSYFVRVYPYKLAPNQILKYTLKLLLNGIQTSYSGTFHEKYKDNMVIIIDNPITFTNIAFRFETSSGEVATATLLFAEYSYDMAANSIKKICRNKSSSVEYWYFIVHDNVSDAFSLNAVNYKLQYFIDYYPCQSACPKTQQWNDITQHCYKIAIDSFSNQTVITISVLTPLIVIGIVVVLFIYLFKKYTRDKLLVQVQMIRKESTDGISLNNTEGQITQFEDKCSICLGQDCDAILQCNHNFHKKCIRNYMKKNKECPQCKENKN